MYSTLTQLSHTTCLVLPEFFQYLGDLVGHQLWIVFVDEMPTAFGGYQTLA
jgi:hypothetical protein